MVQIDPMEYQKFSDYSSCAQSSPSIPVGSTGGDRGSKNDSGCLKARPIPRRCHFKLELGFPYSSNSDEVLRQYVRLCPREPPKGGFRV